MAKSDWRSFNFFDLRPDGDGGKLADALQDAQLSSSTSGNGRIICGDSVGRVHVFNSQWAATTFAAHTGPVRLCSLAVASNHLITIGADDEDSTVAGAPPTTLKCWNLSKPAADGSGYPCVRSTRLGGSGAEVRSLAVADNGQCMAVGFETGAIQLFRGDVKSSRPKDAERLQFGAGSAAIVGMAFKLAHKTLQLFVCNERMVGVYVLPDRAKETLVVLDRDCRGNQCSWMQQQHQTLGGGGGLAERHFMVGQDDAIYCYNSDGRGPCYALKGAKLSVHWFRSYLLTVYQSEQSQNITVIDIQNNMIGYAAPVPPIAAIFIEFGTCYLATRDSRVLHLDERDIRAKLNMLFKQGLYDVGVRVAKRNQFDDEGLAEIFRKYGDHLGARGKHAEAVEQYIKTIGYLEPSYVIQMFLDPRHIDHLVEYLKALHDRGVATANHTTLLLNCFTRLNKSDQLQTFLHVTSAAAAAAASAAGGGGDDDEDRFDVDVAIAVCRRSATEVALTLARQHGRHDAYLEILVADQHAYADALGYMGRLPFADCERNALKFGGELMAECPDGMCELLMRLCTFYAPSCEEPVPASGADDVARVEQLDIMRLLDEAANSSGGGGGEQRLEAAIVQRADAFGLIHLFGERSDLMIVFLEHLLANLNQLPPTIYNTLIELYAAQWAEAETPEAASVQRPMLADKIMNILRSHTDSCDHSQAMIVCRKYEFWPGLLFIFEQQGHSQLVVGHHLRHREYPELFASCTRLAARQPEVWFQALAGLRRDAQCPAHLLSQVLQKVAHSGRRSAAQVLQCLTTADGEAEQEDGGPQIGAVRDYFQQVFGKGQAQLRKDEESVREMEESAGVRAAEIRALSSEAVEFRGTACAACPLPLSLPAVYFMCKHSYHQDCLRGGNDQEPTCPECSKKPETLKLEHSLRAQADKHVKHDQFHHELFQHADPFALVAQYFGYGLFNQRLIVDENEPVDINKNLPDEPPKPTTPASSAAAYKPPKAGATTNLGATEASIRVQESAHMRHEEAIKRLPMPEARMRLQEAGKAKEEIKPVAATPSFRAPQKKPTKPAQLVSGRAAGSGSSSGRSVIVAERAYDPAKDPFAEDVVTEASSLNPFGDCDEDEDDGAAAEVMPKERKPLDRNLNPFE